MARGRGVPNNPSIWAMVIGAILSIAGHLINSQELFLVGVAALIGGIVLAFTYTVTRR